MEVYLLKSTVSSIVGIFIIIVAGIIFTHCKLIDKTVQNRLSSLIILLFTPCLLVTSISKTITLKNIINFWSLPVSAIIYVIIGGIVSILIFNIKNLIVKLCQKMIKCFQKSNQTEELPLLNILSSNEQNNLLIMDTKVNFIIPLTLVCMFKNITSIPLPLISIIVENNPSIFTMSDATSYAISLVLIYASISNMIAWTFGVIYVSGIKNCDIKNTLKVIFSIPNIAVLIGLIIGMVPFFRSLFYPMNAIFYDSITRSFENIGSITSPLMLILFGSLVYDVIIDMKQNSSVVPKIDIFIMLILSLIMIPAILSSIIIIASFYQIIPNDPILLLVLLIETCTPASMNVPLLCEGIDDKNLKTSSIILMLYQYIISTITLTLWVTLFLYLLSNYLIVV